MHEPTRGTIEAGMKPRGWTSSEDAVPIIVDIRPRRGPRAPSGWGGCRAGISVRAGIQKDLSQMAVK
jgi:hypothetical protein